MKKITSVLSKNKNIFLAIVFIAATVNCSAQSSGFKRGQVDLNIGVGYLTPLFNNNNYNDFKEITPPLSATLDVGITDGVSFGVYVGYTQDEVYGTLTDLGSGERYYGKQSTISHTIIGGRLLYHIHVAPRLDVYSGGMLGYNDVEEVADEGIALYGITKEEALTYSVLIGARWRFAKVAGIFVEAGYGVTVLNAGINIKF